VVDSDISIGAVESLFQEGEKDGYNDGSLQRFSKDNEEDWHGKYVDSHDEVRVVQMTPSGDYPTRRRKR
jgi:hypothetical protein